MQDNFIYRYYTAYFLIFCALIACYWNSFSGTWLYDDFGYILNNENIRLTDLTWDGIRQTLKGAGHGSIRPLAFLSFGLNYYFSAYKIFTYHLVNFIIHLTGTCFLLHVIYDTLCLDPVFKKWPKTSLFDASLLAAILWALSPLHVFAVTNIWQRVTSLSGMLMIITLFLYIRARLARTLWRQCVLAAASLLTFGLSLLTKENAVMLPMSIMVYDILFFQRKGLNRLNILLYLTIPVAVVAVVGSFYTNWSWILSGYEQRPFTLPQRLLTEPRVLVLYLSLIVYPLNSRLALLHDITVSHSLISPWTTAVSMLLMCFLVVTAFWKSKQYPFLCYAVLFFFINHLIESSVVPIELVYEYRNYLPAIFIYALISVGVVYAVNFFDKKFISALILVTAGICITSQGDTVYSQNRIMQSRKTFWLANLQKSPNMSCIYNSLAHALWNHEAALEVLKIGERKNHFNLLDQKTSLLHSMGICYYLKKEYNKAEAYLEKALPFRGKSTSLKKTLILSQLASGKLEKAKSFANSEMARCPEKDKPRLLECISLIFLKQGDLIKARSSALQALQKEPGNLSAMAVIAEIYRRQNNIEKSIGFFSSILKEKRTDTIAQLALIELYYRAGYTDQLYTTTVSLLNRIGNQDLMGYIEKVNKEAAVNPYVPEKDLIVTAIHQALQSKTADL